MRVPAFDKAIIAPEKLRDYLLDESHDVGEPKARFFARLGYDREHWQQLAADLREQHLGRDTATEVPSKWGRRFIIEEPLRGPSGTGVVRSVWEIRWDDAAPRLITAYPRGRHGIEAS